MPAAAAVRGMPSSSSSASTRSKSASHDAPSPSTRAISAYLAGTT